MRIFNMTIGGGLILIAIHLLFRQNGEVTLFNIERLFVVKINHCMAFFLMVFCLSGCDGEESAYKDLNTYEYSSGIRFGNIFVTLDYPINLVQRETGIDSSKLILKIDVCGGILVEANYSLNFGGLEIEPSWLEMSPGIFKSNVENEYYVINVFPDPINREGLINKIFNKKREFYRSTPLRIETKDNKCAYDWVKASVSVAGKGLTK